MSAAPPLVVLGCGFAGRAIALAALRHDPARVVIGTTRDPAHAADLIRSKIDARVIAGESLPAFVTAHPDAHVVACFPPSPIGTSPSIDALVASSSSSARAAVYLSSTAVYGDRSGHINEDTPVDPQSPKARDRIAAERAFLDHGAIALRCAGIYGPGRGLHLRIARGDYRIPGAGQNVVSRIHVDDLAQITLAALDRATRSTIYAVADNTPVPQIEAIRWLCDRLRRPLPPSVPLADAPETLRHDRAIDNAHLRRELGVTLTHPSFREGFAHCIATDGIV